MTEATDFLCPQCKSRYKLVRVRAEPGLRNPSVHCRVCKESFAAIDGDYALKYFLVDKPKKRNNVDLRMKHLAPFLPHSPDLFKIGRQFSSNIKSSPRTMTRKGSVVH